MKAYYDKVSKNGYTNGAPCDALQCADSESAIALLEALITLWEVTKQADWLEKAKYLPHHCASWTMNYNYCFPVGSEFHKLDIATQGSVFANAQNKHSAPGHCTFSGVGLLKLYRATGDRRYAELLQATTKGLPQFPINQFKPESGFWVASGA